MTTQTQTNTMQELFNEALTRPGIISDAYSRFYEFSIGNSILAYLQAGNQPIATYKKWQALGRQVKRGAKALELIMPITFKSDKDNKDSDTITLFKPVKRWFAYADTEGAELVHELKTPDFNLEQALSNLSIEQEKFTESNYNVQGYAYKRVIAVNPAAKYPLKTSIHEMAHILLGHTTDSVITDTDTLTRDAKEVEAEGATYLVMAILGHNQVLEESRGYIQYNLNAKSKEKIRINKIFSVADQIIKAGTINKGEA